MTLPRLFIGSSSSALRIARALEYQLQHDAEVTVWTDGVFLPGDSTLESLTAALADMDFAILVCTPDDLVISRDSTHAAIRDNVLFEFGLLVGILGRSRAMALLPHSHAPHIPTDLLGITTLQFDQDRFEREPIPAVGPACTIVREALLRHGSRSALSSHCQIFPDRREFERNQLWTTALCTANQIDAAGISLNSFTSELPWQVFYDLTITRKGKLRLLFQDPGSVGTKLREQEESYPAGSIAALTRTNMQMLKTLIAKAASGPEEHIPSVSVRLFDGLPRFNLRIIDNRLVAVQHYLFATRGVEVPFLVFDSADTEPQVANIYKQQFASMWNDATEIDINALTNS